MRGCCDLKDLAVKDGLQHLRPRLSRHRRSAVASKRRSRARGFARGARCRRVRTGSSRRAQHAAARCAADWPQSLHCRSAHAADADRDGTSAGSPPTKSCARISKRMANCREGRHRSMGQRHLAHRRRRDRTRFALMGCRPIWGTPAAHHRLSKFCQRPRSGARGRCHLADLRPVPRSLSCTNRADRCGSAGSFGA